MHLFGRRAEGIYFHPAAWGVGLHYNSSIMHFRGVSLTCLFLAVSFAQTPKRPLNHKDYDGWRTIAGQHLSADGKFLAYALFPEEGDGEIVVRNLVTGKDSHFPAGERPQPAAPTGEEEAPPQARTATITFSSDSKFVVFSVFPSKAETDKARREKKTAEQMPKDKMTIVELATGKSSSVERVRRFAMPENAAGYLAYQKEAPERAVNAPEGGKPLGGGDGAVQDQQGGRGGRGGGRGAGGRGSEFGTDLVLRSLAEGAERTFPDVSEFHLTDDGKQLVYAVAAHDTAKNGVFAATPGSGDPPAAVLDGKGKYSKLTFDENQTQMVFLSDRDNAGAKPPKWKIYRWDRKGTAAELVSDATAGFEKGFTVSDKGTLTFSRDGARLYFGAALPAPEPKTEEAADPTEEKAVVDLWSYRDEYLQPVQKLRAARDRDRTFTAVYAIASHKLVQLGDPDMETVTTSESPEWALGTDDRAYRKANDYDEHYTDLYLLDSATGARKKIAEKSFGAATFSPSGKYLLNFDGKDWSTIAVPDGRKVNLTASLGVKFFNEDTDTPSTPNAYGSAGWTKDGNWVLVYDRFDVWRIAPDGSGAKNVTAGYGRGHDIRLRYVRTETDTHERWIDGTKPLLFSGENLTTYNQGFFRGSIEGGEPKQLVMAAKSFSAPVKAKDADVYLLTAQTFNEFPDLLTSDGSFKELRKVSDANPQKAGLLWGSTELVPFQNADGVSLQATLYKPENFDAHKKYPMMVYIYERLTQNVNHFVNPAPGTSINISYYVSNGYLVLTPDIVYTVGYPGQSALKCVLPAIQAVVNRGMVDENAIGIQGHSWGGYQIAYMVTQTNRFRAVEAGAPVADMISAYDGIRWGTGITRQFQYERTQSRIGGSIWQYPTRFIENSPIFWADRVHTPVLILQNDGDTAVPWYQGIEFFLALRRLGKEVYLFNYNGQPHGLQNRADQKDYTIRMQQYFDHYLKGAPAPDWMTKGVPYLERDKTELQVLQGGGQ
ncbi:MAG TPA: prolyl oligopeptidase family serine peptidase [Bryobacteraceae bacterium]|jgi:dipeptidyl aminopeptidase/acylaminoacyl peptidase|nr:prolyl oligopeptidase family serine peptidase [Bryobacteraceae bacterium]